MWSDLSSQAGITDAGGEWGEGGVMASYDIPYLKGKNRDWGGKSEILPNSNAGLFHESKWKEEAVSVSQDTPCTLLCSSLN